MIFNSLEFLVFFIAFFCIYWFVLGKNLRLQNLFILFASYLFYAWVDYRLLSLLIGSSLANYLLGMAIHRTQKEAPRKWLVVLGVTVNLGLLVYFKYFNFFISSIISAFGALDIQSGLSLLDIALPLGISFYTFRAISYLLDIDKGKMAPSHDPVIFFSYIAFFPSLMAGPIDRARTLIPQLESKRVFNPAQAVDGLRQILWGLFKKVVIADNCAVFVTDIFDQFQVLPASALLVGAALYLIQIYADFAGYSDMAIGVARLIGFDVTKNFDFPLFSQNIAEFWRKWHISLTSWVTEYVFTPLSIKFRNLGNTGVIIAIFINLVLIGLWHGANWTYIVFGLIQGVYFIPLILRGTMNKRKKLPKGKLLPPFGAFINILLTFFLVTISVIPVRSPNMSLAIDYVSRLFSWSIFSFPAISSDPEWAYTLLFIFIMLLVEWVNRDEDHGLAIGRVRSPVMRWAIYYLVILVVFVFGASSNSNFIYFQF